MLFEVGEKIYFDYSKYYRDREGEIVDLNSDGTYKVAYYDADCGKTLFRNVKLEKVRRKKTNHTIKMEEESKVISEICHKICLEFDIEIPFLSRPYSMEEAEKLYRRLKREHNQ